MKKNFVTSCAMLFLTILFCFAACIKEQAPLNITLYDKPLATIQLYIQGKWKCYYGKGGISANNIQYYDDYYWTITPDNRIEQYINGVSITDTTIQWVKETGTFINGDSTFVLTFYDKQNVPWNYVVDGIFNDTLILHDNTSDAVFYHFTKF